MMQTKTTAVPADHAVIHPIIKANNLSMFFKQRGTLFKALDGVSFEVNKGDFFGIIGESGSGKSTTGKCLIRLLTPSGGRVEIDDHLVSNPRLSKKTDKWLRANVQMVFQDPMASLNPTKNVLQIISEPLIINRSLYKRAFSYFRKVNAVSKYFKYEFTTREAEVTYAFKKQFYLKLTEVLNKYAKDYGEPIPEGSAHFLREAAIAGLDELVNTVQGLAEPIYAYLKDYKQIIQKNLDAYKNREFTAVDVALDRADQGLKEAKREYTYSRRGIVLQTELEKRADDLAAHKAEFKETYMRKNRGYVRSWHMTASSHVKTIRQSILYSQNEVDSSYHRLEYYMARITRMIARKLKQQRRMELELATSAEGIVKEHVTELYAPLMDLYIKKAQAFPLVKGAAARLQVIADIRAIRKMGRAYWQLLKKGRGYWDNFSEFSRAYALAVAKRSDLSIFADSAPEAVFAEFKKHGEALEGLLLAGEAINDKLALQYQQRVEADKKAMAETKRELIEVVNAHKVDVKTKPELAFYGAQLKEAEDAYAKADAARNTYITEFLEGKWPDIQARMANEQAELNTAHQEYEVAMKRVRKTIKNIQHTIRKRAHHDADKKDPRLARKSIRAEFSLRVKSIDALRFEYKNAVNETKAYKRLYTWKPIFTWLLYFSFIEYLKRDAVYNALDSVGLKHEHAYRYPHEFSGGQRQRIVIARALITKPRVIIADEPISALDVSIQAQVINILKDLTEKKGITVLFIAHDLSMVNYVCNRVIIMHRGRILEQGDTDAIFATPIHPYTKSLMLATPKLSRVHVDLSSFDDKFAYDAEWSLANRPEFMAVKDIDRPNSTHLIYGTKEQVKKWEDATNLERAASLAAAKGSADTASASA